MTMLCRPLSPFAKDRIQRRYASLPRAPPAEYDPQSRPGMLYAATERSVWLSYDAGAHWQSLARNLPHIYAVEVV